MLVVAPRLRCFVDGVCCVLFVVCCSLFDYMLLSAGYWMRPFAVVHCVLLVAQCVLLFVV